MKIYLLSFILPCILFLAPPVPSPKKTLIQPNIVVLSCDGHLTTGTIFVKNSSSYILTCSHGVCKNKVVNVSEIVEQDEVEIYRKVYKSKVVAFSDLEEKGGHDLAVLKLNGKNLHKVGTKFYQDTLYKRDNVIHFGYIHGQHPNSYLRGYVSNKEYDEDLNGELFYILSLQARPGCSGGPVYVERNNELLYTGMVTRSDMHGISLMKPVSVIKDWLDEVGLKIYEGDK